MGSQWSSLTCRVGSTVVIIINAYVHINDHGIIIVSGGETKGINMITCCILFLTEICTN